jgi:hypothetical protein
MSKKLSRQEILARRELLSDNRLVEVMIPCAYCIHQIQIANPYHPSKNSNCKAYPTGIPWPIQEGEWKHGRVFLSQEGAYIYESGKAAGYPDGRNYVTWEGAWVTEEEARAAKAKQGA